MAPSNKSEKPLRYRVTVPLKDADVINWMAEQSSVSFSIRLLIRAFIAKYGISDVTCVPVSAGLEMDLTGQDTRPPVPGPKKREAERDATSLTDIRNGRSAAVQQAPPPVQTPQARPVGPAPAGPARTPVEMADLMADLM